MTKKHFEALAAALKERKPSNSDDYTSDAGLEQWIADVYAVADVCAAHNAHFDRARFLAACEMED